jgi:hypothetical protein
VRIDPHEVYYGWDEIAEGLGRSVKVVRRLARYEGLPVYRPGSEDTLTGRGVWTTGDALLRWFTQRALATTRRKRPKR